jgi:hypothetical protein
MAAQTQDLLTSTYYKDLNREQLKEFQLAVCVNMEQLVCLLSRIGKPTMSAIQLPRNRFESVTGDKCSNTYY